MTNVSRRLALALSFAFSVALMSTGFAAAHAADPDPDERPWTWPLEPAPPVVDTFEPPQEEWGSGHRGIDLAGIIGQAVHAVDGGVVTFAGVLAGRGVVVVSHGALRSTYEPVTAAVSPGDVVLGGQVIGLLQGVQSHCLPAACLHLGARMGGDYVDPEPLLGFQQIRLKPIGGLGDDPPRLLPPL
jgi:murein DD-endopeptidase MepM/ murein hydrolase activator NlpD